jgi:hypothetical protein
MTTSVTAQPLCSPNVLEGKIIGRCMQCHRHQEFIRFLNTIEADIPAD